MDIDTMFGTIDNYKEDSYLQENKYFKLSTLIEEKEYEVLALVESKVQKTNKEDFGYNLYTGNITETDFDSYKKEMEDLVINGSLDNLTYEDNILELVTRKEGLSSKRLVLLLKEVQ